MACDCCNLPCGGNGCCCVGDCCAEEITCITVTISGAPPFNITGGPLCEHGIFSGTLDCGSTGATGEPCVSTLEFRCNESGQLDFNLLMPAGCFGVDPGGNYSCDAFTVDYQYLPYIVETNWFGGAGGYYCCPFYLEIDASIVEIYDCVCLHQLFNTPRLTTLVRCPPMGAAAMKRMLTRAPKVTAAAAKVVERVGPLPHPCARHRGLATPCGRAQRGLYTPDQCHLCWWYENHSGYRLLWGGQPIVRTTVTRKVVYADGRKGTTTRSEQTQRRVTTPKRRGRPGDELKEIFRTLGLTATEGCGCDARATQMNAWGVEGCRKNRDAIVKWLQKDSAAMAKYEGDPAELDWGPMVDEAIRLAEEKENAAR